MVKCEYSWHQEKNNSKAEAQSERSLLTGLYLLLLSADQSPKDKVFGHGCLYHSEPVKILKHRNMATNFFFRKVNRLVICKQIIRERSIMKTEIYMANSANMRRKFSE